MAHGSVCCEIFTDLFKVNARMTFMLLLLIFQEEHLLDWSNLDLFDYPYIIFYNNNVKI